MGAHPAMRHLLGNPCRALPLLAFVLALVLACQARPAGGDRGLRAHALDGTRAAGGRDLRLRRRRIGGVFAIVRIMFSA